MQTARAFYPKKIRPETSPYFLVVIYVLGLILSYSYLTKPNTENNEAMTINKMSLLNNR